MSQQAPVLSHKQVYALIKGVGKERTVIVEGENGVGKTAIQFEFMRDAALAKLHTRIVDDAAFLWIAHDVGPRAISPKVKGVVQPKSWFIDIATMSMD